MPGFLLHLAGPMQSWADTGFGQLREAGPFPSRAAVLGVLAAAQGVPRGDARLVELHDTFLVHVAAPRTGRVLRDFHTVETVQGKARTLTTRDYHYDAHFVALIESNDAGEVELALETLRAPVYTSFLGRRACPPAIPLLPQEGDDLSALVTSAISARRSVPVTEERRRSERESPLPVYLDGHFDEAPAPMGGSSLSYGTRRDRLVAPRRAYADRPYTRVFALSDVPQ